MSKKFWSFINQADGTAELLLYGDIADSTWWGDEVTPRQFAQELEALGNVRAITVRINSGGGDVFAAKAIGNQLESHPAAVTAQIDGLCASAATIVACHCDRVVAARDATYMIHPVKVTLLGAADEAALRLYLDALIVERENILSLYAKKTGREREELAGWMDATSWWTADQAKENGFVDEVTGAGAVTVEDRGGALFINRVGMGVAFADAPSFVRDRLGRAPGGIVNTHPAAPGENKKEETRMNEIKTVDDLRAQFPALVGQLEAAAAQTATEEERGRIRDIEEMTLPGEAALADEAKYQKPVSAAEYAKAAVKRAKDAAKRDKDLGAAWLRDAAADADKGGANGVTGAPAPAGKGGGKVEDALVDALRDLGGKGVE